MLRLQRGGPSVEMSPIDAKALGIKDNDWVEIWNSHGKVTGPKNPIHSHFKLRGVFKGDPVPAVRAKLQEDAPEPE